jgi:hypothetical protein
MTEAVEPEAGPDDQPGDEENAGRVNVTDDDPERARRVAAALAIDSDEAPPVAD